MAKNKQGPLSGYRVIEMAGIGPGPYAGMLLADMGAEVVRVDRAVAGQPSGDIPADIMNRGKSSIALNLKDERATEIVLKLIDGADALIEGFRPGVMEKLGLGPEVCLERNPQLVYGRMTGWGQSGPLASAAGHDLNYIAITGALASIGKRERPVPPLNLLGDFGGGSMFLVMGILAALLETKASGKGQVIDAAICDGAISLMSCIHGLQAMGMWDPGREQNLLDGAAHFYDVFECADGEFISLAPIEPQFYAEMCQRIGLDTAELRDANQFDKSLWPTLKSRIAKQIKTRSRADWCAELEGTDVCFAPVLGMDEAAQHPHNKARQNFSNVDDVVQAAPAPRFSRTPGAIQSTAVFPGTDTAEVLAGLGYGESDIEALAAEAIIS